MYTLSVYIEGEIDLFDSLDIVHITLLVVGVRPEVMPAAVCSGLEVHHPDAQFVLIRGFRFRECRDWQFLLLLLH